MRNITKHIDINSEEFLLYEELTDIYSSSEVYKEIIHFMDLAFPEWNSNYGIGKWAPEFINSTIESLDFLPEFSKDTSLNNLTAIYAELIDSYHSYKESYQKTLSIIIDHEFNLDYELEFINLEDDEITQLFNDFKTNKMKLIYFQF